MVRNCISISMLMGACISYGILLDHTYRATTTSADFPSWPLGSRIDHRDADRLLIAFAHPRCPCFATTLSELKVISKKFPDLRICVVFAAPNGAPDGWCSGATWDRVRAAGFVPIEDSQCMESHLFNATASGQLMVFKDRKCLFHGGITAGRGHIGPSAGAVELEHVLSGGAPSLVAYPVFGCPLSH